MTRVRTKTKELVEIDTLNINFIKLLKLNYVYQAFSLVYYQLNLDG